MVDFFLLILIGGAGDELQGIKRGIMEMADGIVVNKADGDNVQRANRAMAEVKNAVHLFPLAESGQPVNVMTCSALTHHNVPEVWKMVTEHVENIRNSGFLAKKRARQDVQTMYDSIEQALRNDFFENSLIKDMIALTETDVKDKRTSAYMAANKLLETYFNMLKK
jgi:LAO/AO transport system kinase